MNKIIIVFLAVGLMFMFGACGLKNEPLYTEAQYFSSTSDLVAYIDRNISSRQNNGLEVFLFEPMLDISGASIDEIKLIGTNIYYSYTLHGANLTDNSIEMPTNGAFAKKQVTAEQSSTPDEFLQSLPESGTLNELENMNRVILGWNYSGHGNDGLRYFVSENADVITAIEGDAGIFASDIVGNNSEVIGKMLYWTQDDCLFQASVPLVVLDSIIDQITAPNPLMQIVK